ncbi:DUF2795 domain-containing protein [Streptomyces bobili]|uniref:DUF2795 domain-containing protein n=1 Tax=Streptomyces bobili TaxID=67280 RepID=UPI003F53F631
MATINPIDLQKSLKAADYPASREDLVHLAKDNGADDALVEKLADAGASRFDGPNDVQKACSTTNSRRQVLPTAVGQRCGALHTLESGSGTPSAGLVSAADGGATVDGPRVGERIPR